jgi:WD40 repeat protein
MHDVFISYAREDLGLVDRLHAALTKSGKDAWRDLKGIAAGEVFWKRIEDAIAASHYFLFVMSPHSLGSENCRRELDFALQSSKRVLPIDFGGVDAERVWEPLRVVQWICASDRFDAAVLELVEAIDGIPQYRRLHTRWLERAREWEERSRDKAVLVRGAELANAEEWLEYSAGRLPEPSELQRAFIKASRTTEESTRDQALGRRLANQADSLLSEGASVLERSMLIAVESMRRMPTLIGHRVLTQGLERLPYRLPSFEVSEPHSVADSGRIVASLDAGGAAIVCTNLAAVSEPRRFGYSTPIRAIELAGDGRLLLALAMDNTLAVIDVASGKELLRWSLSPVRDAHFSRNGLRLAILDESGRLVVFERSRQKPLAELTRKDWKTAKMLAFHGELAAIQRSDDCVSIWSLRDGQEIVHLSPGELERMEFSPDGRRLLTIPPRGDQPALWSIDTGKCISTFAAHNWGVSAVSFSPSTGHLASASSDRTARIWDPNGVNIAILEHETEVFDAVWAADGSHLATRERNGAAHVWDTLGRDRGSTPADDKWRSVLGLWVTGSDKTLVTAVESTGERWVFGNVASPVALVDRGNPTLTSIAFSSDGRYLAALYDYRRLIVHDLATGKALEPFESDSDDMMLLSASPDPRYLLVHGPASFLVEFPEFLVRRLPVDDLWEIAWSGNGDLIAGDGPRIWSISAAKQLLGMDRKTWGVALSADGQQVAAVGPDLPPQVVTVGSMSRRELLGHKGNTNSCAFSADNKSVATGGDDGTARIWDVVTGQELACISQGADVRIRSVAFSPDGMTLATGASDATTRVWDIDAGTEIFRGLHTGEVLVTRFDPSGRYLASGGNDQTARVWDLSTREEIARFRHEEIVYDLQYSPDGNYITTQSAYGSRRVGRIWLWNSSELIRQTESRLTRALTEEEQRYFLGTTLASPDIVLRE